LTQLTVGSSEVLDETFVPGQIAQLYGIFGGIPRQVFDPDQAGGNEIQLKNKVNNVSSDDLKSWISGFVDIHAGFGADQPHGGIILFKPTPDFQNVHLELASQKISEWVRQRLLTNIWIELATYPTPIAWQLLEQYMQAALRRVNTYSTRPCVGISDHRYVNITQINLGGCNDSSVQINCTSAVQTGANNVLYYSSSRSHPLYDMIYKTSNAYYAFQVTIGVVHDAKQRQIDALVSALQIGTGGRQLHLFYAVHEAVFDRFVTNPVEPRSNAGVTIYHLSLVQNLD
jgi:hypothetical protein